MICPSASGLPLAAPDLQEMTTNARKINEAFAQMIVAMHPAPSPEAIMMALASITTAAINTNRNGKAYAFRFFTERLRGDLTK